ncbi:MAG: hypothetical protein IPG68_05840 [Micrococcales bacterium]|nr:hypothetical protein [Micrococcales bacterium]
MNREFLPEAVLGITVGLLLAVVAVYRTTRPPSSGVLRRAGMIGLLVYALIAAQALVRQGMTWIGLLFLLVLLGVAAFAALAGRSRSVAGPTADWTRRLIGVGLTAAMLIAAGQTLSMVGIVDPRVVVVVIAGLAGLLVAQEALVARGRVGSLAMWLMIVPVLISLALGVLLGDPGQAVSPIIEVTGVQWASALGLIVAFLVLGWSDPGMAAAGGDSTGVPARMLVGVGLVVLLICTGLLMFFGGAVMAPSMQFFVVPANIDALPGLAGTLIAVLTVLFTALVASTLTGIRRLDGGIRWLVICGIAAVVLALIDPGLDWVVIATSLVAAALLGSRGERGTQIGLAAAIIGVATLTWTGHMTFGWQSALAAGVVAAVAAVVPASMPSASG